MSVVGEIGGALHMTRPRRIHSQMRQLLTGVAIADLVILVSAMLLAWNTRIVLDVWF